MVRTVCTSWDGLDNVWGLAKRCLELPWEEQFADPEELALIYQPRRLPSPSTPTTIKAAATSPTTGETRAAMTKPTAAPTSAPTENQSRSVSCSPCELNKAASHIKGIVERNAMECQIDGGVPKGWAGSYQVAREEASRMQDMLSNAPQAPESLKADLTQLQAKLEWVGDCQAAREVSDLAQTVWLAAGTLAVNYFRPPESPQ